MTEIKLEDILDKKHALYQLANRLNWEHLINELGSFYCEGPDRPGNFNLVQGKYGCAQAGRIHGPDLHIADAADPDLFYRHAGRSQLKRKQNRLVAALSPAIHDLRYFAGGRFISREGMASIQAPSKT